LEIELIAFTFANCTRPTEEFMKTIGKFVDEQPNIVLVGMGEGMKKTGIFISFHKDFSDFTEFTQKLRLECQSFAETVESFIVPSNKLMRTLSMAKTIEHLLGKE
jgi:hypothetical protein